MCDDIINVDINKVAIKVIGVKGQCKYHEEGQVFRYKDLLPEGMCIHAFHSIYAYCLSLTYDAVFSWMRDVDKDAVLAQCPHPKNTIFMEAKRYQLDEVKKKVEVTITEAGDNCGCKHKPGQKYRFNLGDDYGICPAAFSSIYPFFMIFLQNPDFKWGGDGKLVVRCPDHLNAIDYEIYLEK